MSRIQGRKAFSHLAPMSLAAAAVTCAASAQPRNVISPDQLTDEHARLAVSAIVEELYTRKHEQRFWEPEKLPVGESKQSGGYTALVVLALLHAGETYQDPRLHDAIEYLEDAGLDGTYAVAVRASVWAMLPPKFLGNLEADAQWLLTGFSDRSSGWNYRHEPTSRRQDNSITQYGALALWASARRGLSIDSRYWQALEDRFLDMQVVDGGWNYTGDGQSTGSMTAAGLATLFITQDLLHAQESVALHRGPETRADQAITRALQWMDDNFSPVENPNRFTYYYYYLYAVERAGLASGYKSFGGLDWYRSGAAALIERLCEWDPTLRSMTVHETIEGDGRRRAVSTSDLAFTLLFLSRGRVPVAINKLRVSDTTWNNRPRDVANLTGWLQSTTESGLNWQIVDIDAPPEQWLDAPMLYFASDTPLPFFDGARDLDRLIQERRDALTANRAMPALPEAEALTKLKRYLDLGGFLFAVNEGAGSGFAQSVTQLGSLLYPQYRWRTLPDDHWAYTLYLPVDKRRPTLQGLSNGVRDLILVTTTDLSATLQARDADATSHLHTLANLYLYTSEMNRPRPRLAEHSVLIEGDPDDGRITASPPTVTIVRASYAGNWKPEAAAMEVFAAAMAQDHEFDIAVVDRPLWRIHLEEPAPDLVVVSGIQEHKFNEAEYKAINDYVSGGGMILFETPGGRGAFTLSAERACAEIFNKRIRSLLRDPIVTGDGLRGARRLSKVEYRPFSQKIYGMREASPRLRGMRFDDGVVRIVFSREDISHALLDQPSWGISGYSPYAARQLLANIVRTALTDSGDKAD